MPQVEVTFDIDANGIVNVSAKDLGTGKEQSIKITASSGLNKDEINKLIRDAELHAEEDKKKKELVEARNAADTLIYSTEKSMKDLGDKVDGATRSQVEAAMSPLKKAMEGDDIEQIKRLTDQLMQASHKVAEAMYQKASQSGDPSSEGGAGGPGGSGSEGHSSTKPADDDVVDADFEEVKGKK
jgi:molecular chaperone DnaK